MGDITMFLECECSSDEHVMRWFLFDDPNFPGLYASVFLVLHPNVFKRIWRAVRYVFGRKCRFGHWDEFMMRPEDIGRMRALLNAYEEAVHDMKENDKRRLLVEKGEEEG